MTAGTQSKIWFQSLMNTRIWILSAMPGLILSCMILLLHIPAADDVPPNMGRDFLLKYIPLFLYSFRWNIETSYYEQKTFWSLCSYMVRSCKGIEMLVNLINICYCAMKILPYQDEQFSEYRTKSVQEFRFELSQGIRSQIFLTNFVRNIETHIKSNVIIKALKQLIRQQVYYL